MKTSALTGALLDYWTAKAEGKNRPVVLDNESGPPECLIDAVRDGFVTYSPSSDWADGGPIIERERVSVWRYDRVYDCALPQSTWFAAVEGIHGWDDGSVVGGAEQQGATALIAAMRAYIASKFGDTVPDEVPTA